MKKAVCLLIIITFILSGCAEHAPLERLALSTVTGYDTAEKPNRVMGSLSTLHFTQNKIKTHASKSEAPTSKGIRLEHNFQTDGKIVSGQLRVAIYGKALAEQGIKQITDTLIRDPAIGSMIYLSVSDSTAWELVKFKSEVISPNTGTYLFNLIRQNIEDENIPSSTLHEFYNDVTEIGKDAVLPVLGKSGKTIEIKKLALFSGDRMVGFLGQNQIFNLMLLTKQYVNGTDELSLEAKNFADYVGHIEDMKDRKTKNKINITLENISSKHDIKLINSRKPHFNIHIKIKSRILEASHFMTLSNDKLIDKLEKEIAKQITKETEKTIKHIQKLGSDPIGFGTYYRAKDRKGKVTREKWKDLYKDATFNVSVETEIIRTGTID
ncbi:MAG TPA: Ger(x)C family spore germination protein [Chondromyces sp.]|nr:Ger(x)C family spore germination protein [Chondromyces sp.]